MSVTTFKCILEGKQHILEEKVDIDHGLLSKLEACNVITRRLRDDIEVGCATTISRVRTITSSAPNTQYPILWLLTIPIPYTNTDS